MIKEISFEEAKQLNTIEDVDYYPCPIINDVGCANIKEWLMNTYDDKHNFNSEAWFKECEAEALNLLNNQSAIIEMAYYCTQSRTTETLRLQHEWFDWFINE